MMNIDYAKRQAQALAQALKDLGVGELSPARALDVVARMNGHRNWHTAQTAGNTGGWNTVQQAIYQGYPNADLLALEPGQPYERCGDSLFEALMEVGKTQPLSRVLKTVEHWAQAVDNLAVQVGVLLGRADGFNVDDLSLPRNLAAGLQRFLAIELREDVGSWQEVALRVESTRRDLYAVAVQLRLLQAGRHAPLLLLNSCEGSGFVIPVEIPQGMSLARAKEEAARVIRDLQDRQNCAPDVLFDFGVNELKVKLAQAGFGPCGDTELGPTWD